MRAQRTALPDGRTTHVVDCLGASVPYDPDCIPQVYHDGVSELRIGETHAIAHAMVGETAALDVGAETVSMLDL